MSSRRSDQPIDEAVTGESRRARRDDQESSELAIEKKWLQLARIDIEQFELLYRKYRPKIFRFIALNVRDEDLAGNMTDETFSRAVDKLDSFRWQGYSFGAWLFRIARNVMGQEFRRQRTRPEVRFDPDLHDREDSGARPDRDLESSDEGRLLAECLDRLKPDPREVIVNHYGLGMTTREIGIVMGMAEATVKSHLQRGRKQLLKHLVDGGMERGLSGDTDQLIRETVAREDGWQVLGRGRDVEAGDGDG